MAVLVQKFQQPIYAGVWLGRSLTDGRLEWVRGSGEKLVSGQTTPHSEEWTTLAPRQENVSAAGVAVGESCLAFQRETHTVADLEWAIVDDRLWWLQYRPVTEILAADSSINKNHNNDFLVGVAASAGTASGIAVVTEQPENDTWRDGDILVTSATDPEWVPIMLRSAAIVTAEGGALSHAAIIAREIGIPCVVGVRDALEIEDGATITVNGTDGTVTLQSQ